MTVERPHVAVQRLDAVVPLPAYAHPGDAGADIATAEDVELAPGERRLVRTGIALAVPEGWACFVHPRSGLAAREGLTIVNAPGTVDAGYRGEIMVCLLNTDTSRTVILRRGDLIAQLVFQRVGTATLAEVDGIDRDLEPLRVEVRAGRELVDRHGRAALVGVRVVVPLGSVGVDPRHRRVVT